MKPPRRRWRIDETPFQMLLIPCPYCGSRPELEFIYGGQASIVRPPDPEQLNDEEWATFLYERANPRGLHAERWRHTHGCGRFFNAWRDTVSDRFRGSWKAGDAAPDASP
jgi:sarcosine oxidase subunit delta